MTWAIIQDIENVPAEVKSWLTSSPSVQTVEASLGADYQAFLAKTKPLYTQLVAYAKTSGKADVAALLSDLQTGLETALISYLESGGNAGAAISATATAELAKATSDITLDAKNAVYGGLAIVAANIAPPAIPAA